MIEETYNEKGELILMDIEFKCKICWSCYQEKEEAERCFDVCAVDLALDKYKTKCDEHITDPREE